MGRGGGRGKGMQIVLCGGMCDIECGGVRRMWGLCLDVDMKFGRGVPYQLSRLIGF